jgi:hypothetical protein
MDRFTDDGVQILSFGQGHPASHGTQALLPWQREPSPRAMRRMALPARLKYYVGSFALVIHYR